MFNSIRRVISDVEDAGDSSDQQEVRSSSGPNEQSPPQKTAVIEPDYRLDVEALIPQIHNRSSSDTFTSNSSLSERSEDDKSPEEGDGTPPHERFYPVQMTVGRAFRRLDSSSENSSQRGASSQNSSRDWGWFIGDENQVNDPMSPEDAKGMEHSSEKKRKTGGLVPQVSGGEVTEIRPPRETDAAAMAVTAPTYILEETLSVQRLWKDTAGQRPPQPAEERAFYEKMWAQNFARSQVDYNMPVEVLTATSSIALNPFVDGNFEGAIGNNELADYRYVPEKAGSEDAAEAALMARLTAPGENKPMRLYQKVRWYGSDGDLTVLERGNNVFGTTVSKSFARTTEHGAIQGVDTINISIASYRVVESKKHGKYAQFLVIYREGSIRDTIGVWKRYRDFEDLAKIITHSHEGCVAAIANMSPLSVTEEMETEHLPNAITSWRLLQKRKRWYRCLDAGYLSLKVFLLERFLHDILFESSSPKLLRDFVGADSAL